jgi:hypothetical protein
MFALALSGGKHLEFLLDKNLLKIAPSAVLDQLYSRHGGALRQNASRLEELEHLKLGDKEKHIMLLEKRSGKIIADALEVPELQAEIERAVWQVESALISNDEVQEEKEHIDSSEKHPKDRIKR